MHIGVAHRRMRANAH